MSNRKRNTVRQDEVVSALWEFAKNLGAPINGGPEGVCIRERLDAVGPALVTIMDTFGYKVVPLE